MKFLISKLFNYKSSIIRDNLYKVFYFILRTVIVLLKRFLLLGRLSPFEDLQFSFNLGIEQLFVFPGFLYFYSHLNNTSSSSSSTFLKLSISPFEIYMKPVLVYVKVKYTGRNTNINIKTDQLGKTTYSNVKNSNFSFSENHFFYFWARFIIN